MSKHLQFKGYDDEVRIINTADLNLDDGNTEHHDLRWVSGDIVEVEDEAADAIVRVDRRIKIVEPVPESDEEVEGSTDIDDDVDAFDEDSLDDGDNDGDDLDA